MFRKFIALCLWVVCCVNTVFAQREDFHIKGFHLDLRIQVMKMPVLRQFVKHLADNGINTLVMEWEASYPYREHAVISNQYAYSRQEVKDFINYCDSLHVDVIPLQQSFGHVEYILRHPRYKNLREDSKDYSQVNPTKEAECKALFKDLYKDMISTHHSKYIHIGGDETYLLGHSKASREKVAKVGKGRLYGDYIKMLCDLVVSLGKIPVVWADIALKYPDALEGLPKQTVFVDWNYGWPLDRFGDHSKLMQSGFEIWGSPAIRSGPDNYFLSDWAKHFDNISTFIPQARKLGYKGIVMTSWSTSGIYSPVFESATDIVDLYAVRRVYPLSGFNMLVDAYLRSVEASSSLNIRQFIDQYCKEKFDFNLSQSGKFWAALKAAPYEVVQDTVPVAGISIAALLDSAQQSAEVIRRLQPRKNSALYGHYLLMADIRVFYLSCMEIQYRLNKDDFNPAIAGKLLSQLKRLHPEKLDQRFALLNKDWLYPAEIGEENRLRNYKWHLLKQKLEAYVRSN